MNKLAALVILTILLTSSVYAADVAYILKYESNPEDNIISALNELNLSYELIDDSELPVNFSNYKMIIVNDDNFGSLVSLIPVNQKNALFLSKSHVDEWHWASTYSTRSSSQTIKGRILIINSITQGFTSPVTLSSTSGSYYVLPKYPSRARSIDNIISTDNFDQYPIIASAEPGELLRDSVISQARGLFFGLGDTDNWNNNAKQIFKNSVIWVLYGNDRDDDGVYDEEDNCIDNYNPDQNNSDDDSLGDACDVCPLDGDNDIDGDSVCGNIDNCELEYNPLQENFDSDVLGDVCDDDIDNDLVLNEDDLCEYTKAGMLVDSDGCANYQHIVINEVEFNPVDETQEYVELYNKGTQTINLAGWKIKDSRGRIDIISSGSIASHSYFVFEEWMSTLDFKNNDSLQLLDNESYIVDETGFLVDDENDGRTWQRRPDGSETWILDLATKGLNNGADVIPPVVSLSSPQNGASFTTDTITFNYSVTDNKASTLNCYFYADFDGVFKQWANKTVSAGIVNDFVATDAPDGSFSWNVKCFDGISYSFAPSNRTFFVDDTPYLISEIPEQIWNEDSSIQINLSNYFRDEDNQNLVYSTSQVENINISIINASATLNPKQNWFGNKNAIFRACDEEKCINSNNVSLRVQNVNDAPVLTNISNIEVNEGSLIQIALNASDVDGDSLVYSINDSRFTGNNPFSWQTGYNDSGIYNVEFVVSDGLLEDSKTAKIKVNDVNEPPHIDAIQDINISEDSGFINDINLTAYDNDGTIVSYNVATENTSQVDCSVSDGKLGVTPAPDWHGTASCIIQVRDDDGATGSTIVNIIVAGLNDAPVIDSYAPVFNPIIAENGKQDFSITWHDIDNLDVNVLVRWYVNNVPQAIGNSFSFTASGSDAEVKVVVSDGNLETEHVWDVETSLIPVANSYNGFLTTNFSGLGEGELISFFPLILEKTGKGKIQFLDAVDLRDVVDFDHYADIKSLAVGIDTSVFPSLKNKAARLTFYNLSYEKTPAIYYNSGFSFTGGIVCPSSICSNISYNAGILQFDVTSFSVFMAGETRTCAQQSGFIFSDKEICTGSLLSAIDTDSCCNIRGMEAPPKFEEDIDVCENITSGLSLEIKNPRNNEEFMLGEDIDIEVRIRNPDDEDIKFDVEAYLFNINENKVEDDVKDKIKIDSKDSETLDLIIKGDAEIEADDDYAVFVLVKGENEQEYCNQDYEKIKIEREEDRVIIDNVKINPAVIKCGDSFELNLKVKNIGEENEIVKLIIENQALGIYQEKNLEIEEAGDDDSVKNDFIFNVPDVESGIYELNISANYIGLKESVSENLEISCELKEVVKEFEEKEELKTEEIEKKVIVDEKTGQTLLLASLIIGIIILLALIIIVVKTR